MREIAFLLAKLWTISIGKAAYIILDTDYDNWAVLTQCKELDTEVTFTSTRVLARSKNLGASDYIGIESAIENAQAAGSHVLRMDQTHCENIQ